MRFVHTADWQIGMKASHVGAAAARVRDERLAAAQRVVDAAHDVEAEFLLVAGDTFENNAVDRQLVQRVADTLARFRGPVFLIPGNHDPLVPGSLWQHTAWRSHSNVRLLDQCAPLEVPGGVLYPSPIRAKHSPACPLDWIDAHGEQRVAVAVAHGTVEGIPQQEPDFPVPRDAAARAGLDYVALGHWHSTAWYPSADGARRMAYSGTHETTKFGERDSGHALLVEIDERGAAPHIRQLPTGGLAWEQIDARLRGDGELGALRRQVESHPRPEMTLLDIRLGGLLPVDERHELVRLAELIEARFLYGRVDAEGLRPWTDDDRWLADLPPGPLQEAARRLAAWSDPSCDDPRPPAASPEVANDALFELCLLVREEWA